MNWVVIIIACVAVIAVVVWFFTVRRHPEQASSHIGPAGVERQAARNDRPAGPGAEGEAVPRAGGVAPGPSREDQSEGTQQPDGDG